MDPVTGLILAQSAMQTGGGLFSTILTNRANKNMAEYAYSKDLEMWNRQNEYNNPSNQMERLNQAGLNPNLVYGSGSAVNTAKEMPRYNAPQLKYDVQIPNVIGTIGQFTDMKVKNAQANNIQADTNYRNLQIKLLGETLPYAISKAISEAGIKASDDAIKAVERLVQQRLTDVTDENRMIDASPRMRLEGAKIWKTQEEARKASAEADLKRTEAQMYEALQKFGVGSKVISAIMPLVRGIFLNK